MFCYKCGTQLDDGAEFCHMCGTKVRYDKNEKMQSDAFQVSADNIQQENRELTGSIESKMQNVPINVCRKKKLNTHIIIFGVIAFVVIITISITRVEEVADNTTAVEPVEKTSDVNESNSFSENSEMDEYIVYDALMDGIAYTIGVEDISQVDLDIKVLKSDKKFDLDIGDELFDVYLYENYTGTLCVCFLSPVNLGYTVADIQYVIMDDGESMDYDSWLRLIIPDFAYDVWIEDQEGEPDIIDYLRNPDNYIGWSCHFEDVVIYSSSTDHYAGRFNYGGDSYKILLFNVETALGSRLLEDDVVIVDGIFNGLDEKFDLPVIYVENIEIENRREDNIDTIFSN